VPDEDGGTVDPSQRALHCRNVIGQCVEAVLDSDHFMTVGLQRRDDLVEA
jgi:hypothetical protein